MPILFQYLLKLSCSLAVVYLFYQLVLRHLTFYNAARWYLLGYSLLSFFIPLMNITPFIEQHQLGQAGVVQVIPSIENYTGAGTERLQQNMTSASSWNAVLLLLVLGAAVLLAHLIIQYCSFRHVHRNAELLTDAVIKVYQVDKNITPFSFGNAIYINQHLHSEAELQEIIRHEFVHVMQQHTIDILITELLCILNWYNPAAWLLRHAIRQNLEFIADNQVLQAGVDKKAYQYMLLKVLGQPQFRVATPFNFSSLKKRIVMMNKLKSARVHLVKLLFVLPLIAVLLLAFRTVARKTSPAKQNTPVRVDALKREAVKNNYVVNQPSLKISFQTKPTDTIPKPPTVKPSKPAAATDDPQLRAYQQKLELLQAQISQLDDSIKAGQDKQKAGIIKSFLQEQQQALQQQQTEAQAVSEKIQKITQDHTQNITQAKKQEIQKVAQIQSNEIAVLKEQAQQIQVEHHKEVQAKQEQLQKPQKKIKPKPEQ